MRKTSEVIKTKSAITPRVIQRPNLNLEWTGLTGSRMEDITTLGIGAVAVGSINELLYRCGPTPACTVCCLESACAALPTAPAHGKDRYCATRPPPAASWQMAPGNNHAAPSRESL